jgi:putative acetyltransferase
VRIWRSAVEATHDFLTPIDVDFYEDRLANDYLKLVDVTVAVADGAPVGFSGVADGNLEMFFVVQQHRGRGAGSILLRDAMAKHPGLLIDVNEQNPQAVGFYHHHGFVTLRRSETDADGRPFPILHLGLAVWHRSLADNRGVSSLTFASGGDFGGWVRPIRHGSGRTGHRVGIHGRCWNDDGSAKIVMHAAAAPAGNLASSIPQPAAQTYTHR